MKLIRADYAARHPERIAKTLRDHHQKKRTERLENLRVNNRKRGHAERPKGPKARLEIEVPVSRRWRIFTDQDGVTRLYFTSKKGFELSEVQTILREFKSTRQKVLESQL